MRAPDFLALSPSPEGEKERRIVVGSPPSRTPTKSPYPQLTTKVIQDAEGEHTQILDEAGNVLAVVHGAPAWASFFKDAPLFYSILTMLDKTLGLGDVADNLMKERDGNAVMAGMGLLIASQIINRSVSKYDAIMSGTPKAA